MQDQRAKESQIVKENLHLCGEHQGTALIGLCGVNVWRFTAYLQSYSRGNTGEEEFYQSIDFSERRGQKKKGQDNWSMQS